MSLVNLSLYIFLYPCRFYPIPLFHFIERCKKNFIIGFLGGSLEANCIALADKLPGGKLSCYPYCPPEKALFRMGGVKGEGGGERGGGCLKNFPGCTKFSPTLHVKFENIIWCLILIRIRDIVRVEGGEEQMTALRNRKVCILFTIEAAADGLSA